MWAYRRNVYFIALQHVTDRWQCLYCICDDCVKNLLSRKGYGREVFRTDATAQSPAQGVCYGENLIHLLVYSAWRSIWIAALASLQSCNHLPHWHESRNRWRRQTSMHRQGTDYCNSDQQMAKLSGSFDVQFNSPPHCDAATVKADGRGCTRHRTLQTTNCKRHHYGRRVCM